MLKMSTRPPPIPSAMVHSRGGGGGGGDEGGGGGGGERQQGGGGGGGREGGGGGKGGDDLNQSGQSASIASPLNLSTADIPQVQVIISLMQSILHNQSLYNVSTGTAQL